MNHQAIERGIDGLVKVNMDTFQIDSTEEREEIKDEPKFIKDIQRPMARLDGDDLPTSAFMDIEDGTFPLGTAAYEKEVLLLWFLSGRPKIVFNAINVLLYVPPML